MPQSNALYDDGTALSPLDSEKHIFAQIAANTGRLVGTDGASVVTATATGLSNFRSLLVDSTAVVVKASAGNVFGINIINWHSAAILVKLYDIAAASVNPASSAPKHTLLVQAKGSILLRGADLPYSFATAISVRGVTDFTDTGTTAPATLPIIEIDYK